MRLWLAAAFGSLLITIQSAQAQSGDGYNYNINPSNAKTITITEYTGPGGAVIIPTKINGLTVTSIGDDAFYGCASLTSVTIPAGVTSIGEAAFYNCTSLINVAIPAGITNIGPVPFGGDTSLTAITVDTGNSFFSSTNGILFDKSQATLIQCPGGLRGNYTIPGSVTTIAYEAFYFCTNLTNVAIPASVTTIGQAAFYDCTSLINVAIDSGLTNIGSDAFEGCTSLSSVTIPGSVTSIGGYAFESCTSLTNVTIPAHVTSIGDDAFFDCTSLINVVIPASVTSIGTAPFGGDTSLTAITVDAENSFFSSTNGILFDKSQDTLIQYPGSLRGNYTIPGRVTTIAYEAFYHCTNLTGITIPASVSIAFTNSEGFDGGGFAGCSSLTNATIADGVTSIGAGEFSGCSSLTSITIPNSVTSIGDGAFSVGRANPGGLTSVTIPDSVTYIGNYAFYWCVALTNVTIGNSVTIIGSSAFEYCVRLTSITIPGGVTSIPGQGLDTQYGPFESCFSLTNVYFTGNAPLADRATFLEDPATAYYLPGTTGWGAFSTNTGLTAVPWTPLIQVGGANFGLRSNQFGFNINWASGQVIVVEGSTNLAGPVWTPLQTNTLTSGSFYFSEPVQTSGSGRYYRISSP